MSIELNILNDKVTIEYGTKGSAAFDLQASIDEPIHLYPSETKVIKSGIAIGIDNENIAALVMPRSGKSIKGLTVANSPGLIDSDFRNEIGIIVHNNGLEPIQIGPLERIAQLMFVPVIKPFFKHVTEFSDTTERTGGFGSTG